MLTPAELVWLIAAVAKGDEAAFERLYGATRAKLFGVVLRILRRQDLAEEVIQEAYVKIWNSAGQFNPGLSSPITWMASIARNRAIDVVRKRSEVSIEEEPSAMEVAADTPDPLARREMTEELKRLLECVGRLEPDRQKLVLLAYYNGWSREQLAAKVRDAGEYGEDLAAPQHDGYPGVPWAIDDGLQRRPYRARRGIRTRHSRCRRACAGRGHDVRRQGLHGDGRCMGAQARRSEPDGRIGRAARRSLGQYQNRDRACRTAGPAGAAAGAGAAAAGCRRNRRARRVGGYLQRHPPRRNGAALAQCRELHDRDRRLPRRHDLASDLSARSASRRAFAPNR